MGKCCKWVMLVLGVLVGWGAFSVRRLLEPPKPPQLDPEQWWGPGKPPAGPRDVSVRPFQIHLEPEAVEDLKRRLQDSSFFTEPLEGVAFEYGFNNRFLKTIVDYWREDYDFSAAAKRMNRFPQFKTNIQGLDMHFLHLRGPKQADPRKQAVPLLLLHGWPGSVLEFHKMIPLLMATRQDRDFTFELVIPSLPGFGYSQAASKPGLADTQMAVIVNSLMSRLGYQQYVVQGGDLGSVIGSSMAIMYPERVLGYHTNFGLANTPIGTARLVLGALVPALTDEPHHRHLIYPLTKFFGEVMLESGHTHIQATKPDTIGIALKDSPIGLAAYILEKFSTWTNRKHRNLTDGGLSTFTRDELLDNVLLYWHSGCITTSMRFFSETFSKEHTSLKMDFVPVLVPTAIARFEHELIFQSEAVLRTKYPRIVRLTDVKDGGHFAPMEHPQTLAEDVWTSVQLFRKLLVESKNVEL